MAAEMPASVQPTIRRLVNPTIAIVTGTASGISRVATSRAAAKIRRGAATTVNRSSAVMPPNAPWIETPFLRQPQRAVAARDAWPLVNADDA